MSTEYLVIGRSTWELGETLLEKCFLPKLFIKGEQIKKSKKSERKRGKISTRKQKFKRRRFCFPDERSQTYKRSTRCEEGHMIKGYIDLSQSDVHQKVHDGTKVGDHRKALSKDQENNNQGEQEVLNYNEVEMDLCVSSDESSSENLRLGHIEIPVPPIVLKISDDEENEMNPVMNSQDINISSKENNGSPNFLNNTSMSNYNQNQVPFKCPKCRESFILRRDLIDHIYLHNCKNNAWRTEEDESNTNVVINDSDSEMYGETTGSPQSYSLVDPQSYNDHTDSLRCNSCGMEFAERSELVSHSRTHRAGRSYDCPKCDKIFVNKLTFLYHTLKHDEEENPGKEEGPTKCDICEMEFSNQANLKRHRRAHRPGKTYSCELCNKVFPHKLGYLYHAMEHKVEGPYNCSYCGLDFEKDEELMRHCRSHRVAKTYKCPDCDECFFKKLDLLYHSVEHNHTLGTIVYPTTSVSH